MFNGQLKPIVHLHTSDGKTMIELGREFPYSLSLDEIENQHRGEHVLIQGTAQHIRSRQPTNGIVLYHGNWGGLYEAESSVIENPDLTKLYRDMGGAGMLVVIYPGLGKLPSEMRIMWGIKGENNHWFF